MPKQRSIKTAPLASNSNESAILCAVRDKQPVSRSRLAELTGMTLQKVSRVIDGLLERDILTEIPLGDFVGPRRKRALRINPHIGYCLAVSYGPAGLEGCIMNAGYDVVSRQSLPTELEEKSQSEIFDAIQKFVSQLFPQCPKEGECWGLAIADPGLVDEAKGVTILSSTLAHWKNVPVKSWAEKTFDLPVSLISGGRCNLRAIDMLEIHKAVDNLIYIAYGQGVGCSIKLHGRYITGAANWAGEFGHMAVTSQPIPCRCGARGCLEAMAAFPALLRNFREFIAAGGKNESLQEGDWDGLAILQAAGRGDRLAETVVHQAFEHLGRAVGGLVNLLAPQMVVFDNVIAVAGQSAVDTLYRNIQQNALPSHYQNLQLRISEISTHLCCQGAAVVFLDDKLERVGP